MMHTILAAAAGDDAYIVSPGIAGFLSFLVLAVAGWLLFASLTRHVRKASFHAAEREEEKYGAAAPRRRPEIPVDPNLGRDQRPGEGPAATIPGEERD